MESKKVKILILIILLIAILITAVIISLNVYNNQKVSEIKQLVEKTASYNNYYYETKNESGQTIVKKVKDNIMLYTINDTITTWKNYNTNECIVFYENNAIVYESVDDYLGDGLNQIYPTIIGLFDESEYKIKYIGKEEIDGKQCLIIEFTNKENNNKDRFWIDEETGVFYKWIMDGNGDVSDAELNYKVELNTMTDTDVAKPDLTQYNVVQADENA